MRLLLLVFGLCAVGRGTVQTSQLLNFGYYWRYWNANSKIPEDAVRGGIEADGQPTYIGKFLYTPIAVILPGKVCPVAKKLFFELNFVEYEKTEFIEILCALNENRIKWVEVNSGTSIQNITENDDLIVGGQCQSNPIYIGRQKIGNEIQIGKVFADPARNVIHFLVLNRNGKGWVVYQKFEVLVYVSNESADND